RIRYRPDAVIYHHGGGTLGRERIAKMYYNQRNSVWILLKNYHIETLVRILPVRWLLDAALIVKSLLTLDLKRATAVIMGWIWLFTHPRLILRKRHQVQRKRTVNDTEACRLLYPHSVAVAFYLRGKQTFSQVWPAPPLRNG
ncbi:glycosyltransferase family 2 protein, partial [Candidatus Neomarinimicrobiota bacterium]